MNREKLIELLNNDKYATRSYIVSLLGLSEQDANILDISLSPIHILGIDEPVYVMKDVGVLIEDDIISFREIRKTQKGSTKTSSDFDRFITYYNENFTFMDFVKQFGMDIYAPFRQKEYAYDFMKWVQEEMGYTLRYSDFSAFIEHFGYFYRSPNGLYKIYPDSDIETEYDIWKSQSTPDIDWDSLDEDGNIIEDIPTVENPKGGKRTPQQIIDEVHMEAYGMTYEEYEKHQREEEKKRQLEEEEAQRRYDEMVQRAQEKDAEDLRMSQKKPIELQMLENDPEVVWEDDNE